jgi:hypothetical protein
MIRKYNKLSVELVRILSICFVIFTLQLNIIKAQVSFVTNGQNLTSPNSWDVRLADINGDRHLDAYFENRVWLNDGQGKFTKTALTFGERGAYFADFNGDGKVDVLCNDSILLNDGAYKYSFFKLLPTNMTMNYAELADVDNDGDIDIIVANQNTDTLFINNGKAGFTNAHMSFGGWGQCRYASGDINGDDFTDIYVAIPHTPPPKMVHAANKIWLGDGKGNFIEKNHDIPGAESRSSVLADFDSDGDLDLFVATKGKTGNMIFLNDGKGNLTDSGQKLGIDGGSTKTADFDNDGDLDLFICFGNVPFGDGAPNMVWLNDGKGKFIDSNLRLGSSNSVQVETGDINDDKKIDAVVVNVRLDNKVSPPVSVSCPVEIWLNKRFECNYLNESKPGSIPVIFGKGKISVAGKNTHACVFFPDGKLLVFSRYPDKKSYLMAFSNGKWSDPTEAFFYGKETFQP